MTDALLKYTHDTNPCFGCTSAACRSCACAGEKIVPDTDALKVPVSREKPVAKKTTTKKPAAAKKKDPFTEVFGTEFETVAIPTSLFGDVGDAFVVRADGDGMRNAGIFSGDKVIFEKNRKPEDGDIIACQVEGTLMCRRVFHEENGYRIRREDGETPDILTSDCVIFGVMVGLARNCRKAG